MIEKVHKEKVMKMKNFVKSKLISKQFETSVFVESDAYSFGRQNISEGKKQDNFLMFSVDFEVYNRASYKNFGKKAIDKVVVGVPVVLDRNDYEHFELDSWGIYQQDKGFRVSVSITAKKIEAVFEVDV